MVTVSSNRGILVMILAGIHEKGVWYMFTEAFK